VSFPIGTGADRDVGTLQDDTIVRGALLKHKAVQSSRTKIGTKFRASYDVFLLGLPVVAVAAPLLPRWDRLWRPGVPLCLCLGKFFEGLDRNQWLLWLSQKWIPD